MDEMFSWAVARSVLVGSVVRRRRMTSGTKIDTVKRSHPPILFTTVLVQYCSTTVLYCSTVLLRVKSEQPDEGMPRRTMIGKGHWHKANFQILHTDYGRNNSVYLYLL